MPRVTPTTTEIRTRRLKSDALDAISSASYRPTHPAAELTAQAEKNGVTKLTRPHLEPVWLFTASQLELLVAQLVGDPLPTPRRKVNFTGTRATPAL